MTIGDPKKAAVLGVVALIVSSVAVFRALPRADRVVNTLLAPADPEVADVRVPSYPEVLARDPFSHTALAKKEAPSPANSTPEEEFHPPYLPGNVPGMDVRYNGEGVGAPLPNPTGSPEENTGLDRNSTVEDASVSVAAILVSDRATVMLRLNGGSPVTFKAGQTAFERAQVVKVDGDGVTLKTPKRTVTLKVGETVKL